MFYDYFHSYLLEHFSYPRPTLHPAQQQTIEIENVPSKSMKLCRNLISADSKVMYAGYMERDGKISAEVTRSSISAYNKLSIIRLPLGATSGDALVLAIPVCSDIAEIVALAKHQFATSL